MSEKITPGAKEIICKLVDSIGSPTASAKVRPTFEESFSK